MSRCVNCGRPYKNKETYNQGIINTTMVKSFCCRNPQTKPELGGLRAMHAFMFIDQFKRAVL